MSLGTGPDIEQFDREREKEVKLGDEVQAWFDSLGDRSKFKLMEQYYPEKAYLVGLNVMWESISFDDQLDIYKEQNGYRDGVMV